MGKRIQVKERHYKKLKKKPNEIKTDEKNESKESDSNSEEKQAEYDNDDDDQVMKIVKCCQVRI